MASKPSSFSKWGLLEAAGITEDLLLTILANSTKTSDVCYELITRPTHGILIELYHFASLVHRLPDLFQCTRVEKDRGAWGRGYHFASITASTLQQRPNRVLKLLVETLFPQCKVSRADRLERRIKCFDHQLDSIASEEQDDYLQKEWTPQATGICVHVNNITLFGWSVVQWKE